MSSPPLSWLPSVDFNMCWRKEYHLLGNFKPSNINQYHFFFFSLGEGLYQLVLHQYPLSILFYLSSLEHEITEYLWWASSGILRCIRYTLKGGYRHLSAMIWTGVYEVRDTWFSTEVILTGAECGTRKSWSFELGHQWSFERSHMNHYIVLWHCKAWLGLRRQESWREDGNTPCQGWDCVTIGE